MYLGRVVEMADRDAIYESPRHPYTRALMAAAPVPVPPTDGRRRQHAPLAGEMPSPAIHRRAAYFTPAAPDTRSCLT
jgi:oligopeptide/dipeptide ABC transporter ATP-binding protein